MIMEERQPINSKLTDDSLAVELRTATFAWDAVTIDKNKKDKKMKSKNISSNHIEEY